MKILKPYVLYIAWIQALIAMLGSLYFSEIAGFAPCLLCWYQRIAMYPLIVILAVGIIRRDSSVHWYALPLALVGSVIAIYHNLMYYGFIPENLAPCTIGASCNAKYIEWLGFVTIPFLSLCAFVVIIGCLLIHMRSNSANSQEDEE